MQQSKKEVILGSLSDASEMLIVLWNNLDNLIEQCEIENRYPSIQELRILKEYIDDANIYIKRTEEIINQPDKTSKTWIS